MTTRKPKTPRTLRYSPEGRTLLIADRRERAIYGVDPLACEAFPEAVAARFTKLCTKDAYDVRCGKKDADASCECRGWLRWHKPCRHIDALAKLVELGHIAR
jgi:hypothetical protein